VYKWDADTALVQTADFFTPIVDDPYVFGQIAAANALSDIYAMGGRPMTALAIAAFPAKGLEAGVMQAVFRGGLDKLTEAGVALLGGHTVQDAEIKFGYAITGTVHPARVLTNAAACPGDLLILTKPLGTGVVATAIKFDRAPAAIVAAAVSSMTALNRTAARVLGDLPAGSVHACTDVTGFGLIGHASEMAAASGVTISLDAARVPVIAGVRDLVARNRTGGGSTNEKYFGRRVEVTGAADPDLLSLLYDPQTSGGLCAGVDAAIAPRAVDELARAGVEAAVVGQVEARRGEVLVVVRA
jgi:selenide,water dikinase